MSIGKSGVKNLAFLQDDSDDLSQPVYADCEDNVSECKQAGPEPHLVVKPLYKGKNITARGYVLIASLAATVFAGRSSNSRSSLKSLKFADEKAGVS